MQLYNHHFIDTNGVTLHVVEAGPQDGPPVILLHGFPEFWYGWRRQIDMLAEQGYHVFAPDQRGYNSSDKPATVADYSLDLLAGDIVGLMDVLGIDKVYLAGHDWGAVVAWWLGIRYPERLHRLAILNVPHPSVMIKTLNSSWEQRRKSWYIAFFQIPALPEALWQLALKTTPNLTMPGSNPGVFTPDDMAEYRRAWSQPGALTGMINWYRALARYRPSTGGSSRVTVPTFIIWGRNDVALTAQMAEASLKYCDDGRLEMIDEATHWVQHDAPERVGQMLADFFHIEATETK